jgi:hypothetical protein
MVEGALGVVAAQNPFGAPRPSGSEPQMGGIVGWLLAKQSEFYREMSSTLRAAKSDGSAVWTLFAISFAYGTARHCFVVCIRLDAVAGRGSDRHDLRLAAQCIGQNDVRR